MRILIISDVSGYMRGGVPVATGQLMRGLSAKGHELALLGDVRMPGAEAARHFPMAIPTGGALAAQVRGAIATFEPELVHVVAMSSWGLLQIAPVLRARPWLMSCHSLPPYERKLPALHGSEALHYAVRSLRFFGNTVAWKCLLRQRLIPRLIVHSEVMRDTVVRYGFEAARTTLIPLGCEPSHAVEDGRVRSLPDGPRIVTLGGIAHTKGQHDAIAALAQLRQEFPNLHYQFIGELRDRSYLRFLQRSIARWGLHGQVQITPNLANEEKERALGSADLYLQPSHEEGFCLAYIEAAGVVPRLVGTDTGAIRLIGAGDEGMRTVPVRQPSLLAEAMRELLRAPLPADLMPRRAARLAARFSWSQYIDGHESLYGRAVNGGQNEPAAARAA